MHRPFLSPLFCAAILGATLIVGITPCSRAQETQSPSCTRRTIAVSVLDKNGEPITGLTAADFRAEFRGKPVRIVSAGIRTRLVRIVVALDNSKSMHSVSAIWRVATEAVRHLFASAPTDSSLALLVFSDKIEEKFDFGQHRRVLDEYLPQTVERKGGSNTRLRDAMVAALEFMPSPQPGDIVYVVTDGRDGFSRTSARSLEEKFLHHGVRLFTFLVARFDEGRVYVMGDVAGPGELFDLVESTGGGSFPINVRPENRAEDAAKLYRRMVRFHELEIEVPLEVDKRRDWKLELVRTTEFKHSRLGYPRFLVPCSSSTQP